MFQVSSRIGQCKSCRKTPLSKPPCIKNAFKETKEIGWMQQPVVKNPSRFKVELASSSDCKFGSILACSTELIADQDPLQLYSNHLRNSASTKQLRLSPVDEFIRAASFETGCLNSSKINSLGQIKSASSMNKEISKFQHEQSRLQRKQFTKTSGHKRQQKSAESFSESVLASPPTKNNMPDSNEVLLFSPFKAKVTTDSRYLQTGTSKTNETNQKTDTTSKHYHRAPIIYNKNAWLNEFHIKSVA